MLDEYEAKFESCDLRDELMAWVRARMTEFYPDQPDRLVTNIGFIHSPSNSAHRPHQKWHIDDDYQNDMNNIFVNMHELSIHNSPQFVPGVLNEPESKQRLNTDLDFGPNKLMRSEKRKWLNVCQLVCEPFMILKMHNIAHRGESCLF